MKATTRDLMRSLKQMAKQAQTEGTKRKDRAEMLRVIRMTADGRNVLRHFHRDTHADPEVCRVPRWDVFTSRGVKVGEVYGYNERDALVSVEQSPTFDRYKALQVRPAAQ